MKLLKKFAFNSSRNTAKWAYTAFFFGGQMPETAAELKARVNLYDASELYDACIGVQAFGSATYKFEKLRLTPQPYSLAFRGGEQHCAKWPLTPRYYRQPISVKHFDAAQAPLPWNNKRNPTFWSLHPVTADTYVIQVSNSNTQLCTGFKTNAATFYAVYDFGEAVQLDGCTITGTVPNSASYPSASISLDYWDGSAWQTLMAAASAPQYDSLLEKTFSVLTPKVRAKVVATPVATASLSMFAGGQVAFYSNERPAAKPVSDITWALLVQTGPGNTLVMPQGMLPAIAVSVSAAGGSGNLIMSQTQGLTDQSTPTCTITDLMFGDME